MQKLAYTFRVVLGVALFTIACVVSVLFLSLAFSFTGPGVSIKDKLQCIGGSLLFALIAFAVWRILLSGQDRPLTAPALSGFALPQIDTSKRYDVYCSDLTGGALVYRNVLFKSRKRILSVQQFDAGCEFLELEQANGNCVFLGMFTVQRFCEHGVEPVFEVLPTKKA